MRRPGTILTAVMTLALTATLSAGCAGEAQTSDDQRSGDAASTTPSTPARAPSSGPASDASGEPAETEENQMKIQITIGSQSFTATLQDSPAAHDLVQQLPVTVQMTDHGGVEKTGPLPTPLSLEGQPAGADPDPGDLGYYAPGNDLVLYYGDQSYFPGIVVLGRMDGDAAERIANIDGSVTATVAAR
jgi:hypothetical protein